MRNAGFTLLEVLIAITIIAFLSLFTTQSIQRAMKTRTKVQHTISVNGEMREALRIMERDIQLAFHYRDYSTDLINKAEQARRAAPATGPTPNPTPGATPTSTPSPTPAAATTAQTPYKARTPPPQLTQFVGEAEKINFTTSTRGRTLIDEPTSSIQKVGYFLKDCRNRMDRTKTSQCLWRRTDPYLDDDVTKGGDEVALVEHVESLQFRYLGEGREEWAESWNSKDGMGDETDKFPAAVEITLTVIDNPNEKGRDTKTRKVVMQSVAAIRFPNNAKENPSDPSQTTSGLPPPPPPPPSTPSR